MNDPMIIAAAVVLVVASVGSWYIQVINAKAIAAERKSAADARIRLEELIRISDSKADRIIEQGAEIHTLTNSNLAKVSSDLAVALARIEELEKTILKGK